MMSSMIRQVRPRTSPTTFITSVTLMSVRRLSTMASGAPIFLREEACPLHAARIGRDHRQVRQVQLAEVAHQHRAGEQVIHRDVEEALNLRRVQIDKQSAIRAGRGQQIGHELRRDATRGRSLRSCRAYP